jgi:hypothetical protein
MSEQQALAAPSLDEVRYWLGLAVDDVAGADVGTVQGLFVDAGGGWPVWLTVNCKRGRFGSALVVVPVADCAAGGGRVWVAHGRDAIGSSPVVDPSRSLLREHELTICAHYGIGERVGRAAEVSGRAQGSVTSEPG